MLELENKYVLNVDNESECLNYLSGKTFYGKSARLEIGYDGNAYVYHVSDNQVLFAGNLEIGDRQGNASRKIKIHDSIGGGVDGAQVINLLLSADGKMMDMTDFTIYSTQ